FTHLLDRIGNVDDPIVENLQAGYDRITNKTERELSEGLSFFSLVKRSFSSIFNKQSSAKEWLNGVAKELENGLERELRKKLNDGVIDIADSIQQMGKMIDLKLQSSQNILKNNHDIFSDIAERRANVLRDLQQAFAKFLTRSENFQDEELFPTENNISPNLATGSGIAIVGALLTTLAQGAVFDITGGILTTVGLLFAGVSVGYQRRKIMRGYREEIAKGREELTFEVTTKLNNYIEKIKERIDDNFDGFDELLQEEESTIQQLKAKHHDIENALNEVAESIRIK
ncbi:MAG: GTP-binding protein, partial [Bacteroidota bacterium]